MNFQFVCSVKVYFLGNIQKCHVAYSGKKLNLVCLLKIESNDVLSKGEWTHFQGGRQLSQNCFDHPSEKGSSLKERI